MRLALTTLGTIWVTGVLAVYIFLPTWLQWPYLATSAWFSGGWLLAIVVIAAPVSIWFIVGEK